MSLLSRVRLFLTAGAGVAKGLPGWSEESDPIGLFRDWFSAAEASGLLLPEAMTLSTATPGGVPSSRMVLLKEIDEGGFVYYTNYGSRKAKEADQNPRAALLFHWAVLQRQVRIEGDVERVTPEESEAYFRTRAPGSRLGAWASKQSEVLTSRAHLVSRMEETRARFGSGDVPCPPFWGGYRVRPTAIEFWQGRADRLHDRLRFDLDGDAWRVERLYP